MENLDENKIWASKGNIGCTFASLFAKAPHKIGWETIQITEVNQPLVIPKSALILSIQFPKDWKIEDVRQWALINDFYQESVGEGLIGLRYKVNSLVAWVQYFGEDSHVKTRQSPIPELTLALRLPPKYYWKVGFNGILHVAHASIHGLKDKIVDKLWDTSHSNTTKRIGHKAGTNEAGKVTWKIKEY